MGWCLPIFLLNHFILSSQIPRLAHVLGFEFDSVSLRIGIKEILGGGSMVAQRL